MELLYSDSMGVQIARLSAEGEIVKLWELFEEIACEQRWKPEGQIRAYPGHSVYLTAAVGAAVAGGLHLVLYKEGEPFPALRVWPEIEAQFGPTVAHIAMLALKREFRGRFGLLWPLCVEMWRLCRGNGVTDVWLEVAPSTRRLYQRLGWPLEIIGPLREHWGEDCYLCRMGIQEVADTLCAKAVTSKTYQGIVAQAYRDVMSIDTRASHLTC